MALNLKPKTWPGGLRTVTLGSGSRRPLRVGGGRGLALHTFEATFSNRPLFALEVADVEPRSWPAAARRPWQGVLGQPAAAARRALDEHGADLVMLHLTGTHPDRGNRSAEQAVADVTAVLDAVSCPLIVKGPGAGSRQNEVLGRVAEAASGERLVLHSACQEDYRTLAAVAVAYGHVLVAESPIDINLAKQLSILLSEANLDLDQMLIDPLTGGLGYGLEYTYSVMERIRLAALAGEKMLSSPLICLVGEESWKTKEARVAAEKEPRWGDEERRAIHWEVATGLPLLLAGADILVLRHPEALTRIRRQLDAWFAAGAGSADSASQATGASTAANTASAASSATTAGCGPSGEEA
jgi:acetyl-CoA decarbonylase/synthase complex subunit delta